jgi:FAD/FMN-containing dehydrogenase
VAFPDFMTAARFADALAREDAILKKLVTVVAAPVPNAFLFGERVAPEESVVLLMVADMALDALQGVMAAWPARIAHEGFLDERPSGELPLFEYSWNHTTLHALKHDRTITYLQTLYPPPGHLELVEHMWRHFGDEVPIHLEFVRFGGQIACFGLRLVRYTSDERLVEITAYHDRNGCPVFNPHEYTIEGGGMKKVDALQLAFKREADPEGLLNPGKMIGWDNPAYDESHDRRFLYEGG